MQLVILAGGVASRMKPMADRLPKSLFPVAGRPFLDWQLELVARGGATRVVLVVAHLGDVIAEHLEATRPPLPVTLVHDDEEPGPPRRAGTGGALFAAARRWLLDDRFLVTYGDSYLPVDLRALFAAHLASGLPATMAVHENEGRWDASNVIVEGARVARYEKIKDPAQRPPEMRWIDFGILALDRAETLRWPDVAPFDLAAPLGRLAASGRLGAFTYHERFYEIGSPTGLAELEARLATSQVVSG
jgi:NDP-sugar pyrophosphorylase family protein